MAKVGRNDPCPCGSGKKYKQCHEPQDREVANGQRLIRQAPDTLLPKLLDAVPRFAEALPGALRAFWNNKYAVQTVQELDDHEDRGSERFLTWFLFDHLIDDQTPFERLVAEPEDLEWTEAEQTLLPNWPAVRLQPYTVVSVTKGEGFTVKPFGGDTELPVEDRAATKHLAPDDLLIVHLLPVLDTHYITGAAAHLSPDAAVQLQEFIDLHLGDLQRTAPDATYADLVRQRSHIFNHFVMALPRDAKEMSKLDALVIETRAMMSVMASQMGFEKDDGTAIAVPQSNADGADADDEDEDDAALDASEADDEDEDEDEDEAGDPASTQDNPSATPPVSGAQPPTGGTGQS